MSGSRTSDNLVYTVGLCEGLGARRQHGDGFGHIHRAAAAESDHAIRLARLQHRQRVQYHRLGRVSGHLGKETNLLTRRRHRFPNGFYQTHCH